MIKLVSGRGYLLDVEVASAPAGTAVLAPIDSAEPLANVAAAAEPAKTRWSRFVRRGPPALAAVAGLGAIFGLAAAARIFVPDPISKRTPPTIATMPIVGADGQVAAMAAGLTDRLVDGKIDNVRVVVPQSGAAASSAKLVPARPGPTDFVVKRALRAKPTHIPVLEAYCRFLNATNQFVESLVACAKTLGSDPWDGMALYHMGLAHIQLGRFEDALATFKQADRFDTPQVSRWTWLLGAGWSCVLMGRDEEALPWLQWSIAITAASGRPLMLLAAANWRLGRTDEAKAALAKGLELRPGTTALNVAPPTRNASPIFLAASERIIRSMVAAGLPER